MKNRSAIVIIGPTASGKTRLGVLIAKKFNGEIVSADSRQVYRGLDLGTGKDLDEYDGIKYHLIDIAEPGQKFSLFDYLKLARVAIEDIFSRGKVPVIVGGTGLYVQALTEGFQLEQSQKSKLITCSREQLNSSTVEQLRNILQEIDPERYETIDRNNPHRLIRAIEQAESGERPIKVKPDFETLQIGIDLPREELHRRIDRRVDERFDQGMLEEVVGLLKSGVSPEWLMSLGLEYRVITDFLISNFQFPISKQITNPNFQNNSEINNLKLNKNLKPKIENSLELAAMKQALKWKIHQYARRQLTWFRRFPEIHWVKNPKDAEELTKEFLEM